MGFISNAYAADAAAPAGGGMQMIFILVIFALIFYFMIYRPQAKRNKQHRQLMASLGKGEEVLTTGGIIGKITKVSEENDYVALALNDNNEIMIKKDFIVSVLPKGTLKSLN